MSDAAADLIRIIPASAGSTIAWHVLTACM